MNPDWRQRASDRAGMISRMGKEPQTLTDHITAVTETLCEGIESDGDPDSRLPRWGEVLRYLCYRSRQDWFDTTGTVIDFDSINNEGDDNE